MAHSALGRGLSSLLEPSTKPSPAVRALSSDAPVSGTMMNLPLEAIDPNPFQPRDHFDQGSLEELAASIQAYGLLEPVIVTPLGDRWQLVAGERRFRAMKLLHASTIPAIVRSASKLEKLEIALIENIQRADLNPLEKAVGIAKLLQEFGLTQEEAARRLGMARSSVANSVRLLELPREIQDGLANGKITEGHAKILLGLSSADEQLRVFRELTQGNAVSVRALHERVRTPLSRRRSVLDPEYQDLEEHLQATFGTKVQVKRGSRGGHIVIHAYSEEEFRHVIRKLKAL